MFHSFGLPLKDHPGAIAISLITPRLPLELRLPVRKRATGKALRKDASCGSGICLSQCAIEIVPEVLTAFRRNGLKPIYLRNDRPVGNAIVFGNPLDALTGPSPPTNINCSIRTGPPIDFETVALGYQFEHFV